MTYIYGLELLHATQAVDLRREKMPTLTLGETTAQLYQAFRAKVPFVSQDRIYSDNIEEGARLVNQYK